MGNRHPIFTDEHQMLRDSLRRFIATEVAPHADEWEKQGSFPHLELFKRFGELGFLGINLPEEYGGSGAGFVATAVSIPSAAGPRRSSARSSAACCCSEETEHA